MSRRNSDQPFFDVSRDDIKKCLFDALPIHLGICFVIINLWIPLNQFKDSLGKPFHGVHSARLLLPCSIPFWGNCLCVSGLPYKDLLGLILIALFWTLLRCWIFKKDGFSLKWFVILWIFAICSWWITATVLHMMIDPTPMDLCLLDPLFTSDQVKELVTKIANERNDL